MSYSNFLQPRAIAILSIGILFPGCSQSVSIKSTDESPAVTGSLNQTKDPQAPPSFLSGQENIEVRIADRQAFDALIEAHQGKVILVDFWARWCIPCVKQFPHTVELSKKYSDRGLTVISVCLEDVEDIEEVRKFLIKQQATFDNLLGSQGSSDATFEAFELSSVPVYRVYDRSGKLHKEFSVDPTAKQQYTLADIEQLVNELL